MRVALFSDSFGENLGGLTRAVIALHERLSRTGHTVRVFTLPHAGGPIHPGDVHLVRAVPLRGMPGLPPDSQVAWDYLAIRRELSAWRPDIVHLHTLMPVSWLGLLAARSLGFPVVATYHANVRAAEVLLPAGKMVTSAAGPLMRALYNRCDTVIAPSHFAAQELQGFGVKQPVAVVSNGVDLDRFAPAETQRPGRAVGTRRTERPVTVLFAGRLSPEKGVGDLVKALDIALRVEPCLLARIAGHGPLADAVRRALAPYIAAGRVSLPGHVPWKAMPAEYQAADIFFFPSPAETQGLAVLEAMATGLPVVAVRAGALPELVRDGENGILVPPGDVLALARAVVFLARHPELQRRLGLEARATAREHEARRVLGEVLALYARVVAAYADRREDAMGPRAAGDSKTGAGLRPAEERWSS